MKMSRNVIALMLVVVFAFSSCLCIAEEVRTTWTVGDSGEEVLALKNRLQELNYYSNGKMSDQYNDKMVEKVTLFQAINGLKPDGIVTPDVIEAIYSRDARTYYEAPLMTEENKEAFIFPTLPDDLPMDITQEGFLRESGKPFILASRENGYWLFISGSLRIEIKRYSMPTIPLTWFETDIRMSPNEKIKTLMPNGKKVTAVDPRELAKNNHAVLAVSDDFYGFRVMRGHNIQGIVIRDGEIKASKTKHSSSPTLPNFDVMARFPDGTLKTFHSDEYSAQEYLDMGVTDTWAFGPYLIRDGSINEEIKKNAGNMAQDPRNAFGMIEPYHYLFLSVVGRSTSSNGVTLSWLASRMKDLNCNEALNLDGGNSVALIFMGDIINKSEEINQKKSTSKVTGSATAIRNLSSLMGFGEYIPDEE